MIPKESLFEFDNFWNVLSLVSPRQWLISPSFYARRSQKRKNNVKPTVSFCTFGTFESNSCIQKIAEIDTYGKSSFRVTVFVRSTQLCKVKLTLLFLPNFDKVSQLNFTNVLQVAFVHTDLKTAKDSDALTVFSGFWDLCV